MKVKKQAKEQVKKKAWQLFFTGLCFFTLLFSGASAFAEAGLVFSEPWVRQAPPSAKYLAGYGTLKNTSAAEIKIVSLRSALFKKVELHVSEFDHGMMKMHHLKHLVLKSGESIVFEPSGRHLMLVKPLEAIKSGAVVPVIITLSSGQEYAFDMPVKR